MDEISWRRNHKYLTLVSDHDTSTIVWGAPGKDTATLEKFFTDLPAGTAQRTEAVSMDLGPAYAKAVREHAPAAVICFDPFHVVKLATDALVVFAGDLAPHTVGRHEGLNNKIRLIINRAYGFHSAQAALALVMLACGPVNLELPYHTTSHPHSHQ